MDIKSILNEHKSKKLKDVCLATESRISLSEVPDLFFDVVLVEYKLTRIEILSLMFLYRKTWNSQNPNKKYALSPQVDLKKLAYLIGVEPDLLKQTLGKLEEFGFIESMRSNTYFVRRYFTAELDKKYGQNYDNFL